MTLTNFPRYVRLLAKTTFFHGMQKAEIEASLRYARRQQGEAGSYLFHQGDPAARYFVLLQGRIQLTQLTTEGQQIVVHLLQPGEEVAIVAAFPGALYPLTAEALTNYQVLAWDQDALQTLLDLYPRLALNGLRMVTGRFVELQHRYLELATQRVERRVARTLIRLADKSNHAPNGLQIAITRQTLAEMTGTTLYTVSRTCRSWEEKGLIHSQREQLTICDYSALSAIAETTDW